MDDEIIRTFSEYDEDGDGYISLGEMRRCLERTLRARAGGGGGARARGRQGDLIGSGANGRVYLGLN